jgi:hypothetical protein
MPEFKLLWGDLHTHLTDLDHGDELLRDARENIDFTAVLCYPFVWEEKKGLRVESVRNRPEFTAWWERLRELCRAHYAPGEFATFLGYEWNGNRTHYGDHNVIYYDEQDPLDDAWSLEDLYANLRKRKALAIPHHTAYYPNRRGKDWSVWDEHLSPVMEICSIHGSSEACVAPVDMVSNASMGPRASGSTFHDALARGYRIGVIGSNDYEGLAGRWGIGRAAVWATDCTREAIWDALLARRTYGVTGDRIELDFSINGQPMGSVLQSSRTVAAEVTAVGSHAIDRIELVHNGRVVATANHTGNWAPPAAGTACYKFRVEAGWGPAERYGFKPKGIGWAMRLDLDGGTIVGAERCFTNRGQRIAELGTHHCTWNLVTTARRQYLPQGMTQAVVFEIEGDRDTRLRLQVDDVTTDGLPRDVTIGQLLGGHCLVPLIEESERRIHKLFDITVDEMVNPDPVYHNARKVKLHQAVPESGYCASYRFQDIALAPGRNAFYARVSQLNGQLAWSSPIWVDVGG